MQHSLPSSRLDIARTWLYNEQQKVINAELVGPTEQFITDAALEVLERQTQYTVTELPHLVRRGGFRYEREHEDERIARAKAIIRRVAPGPFEDPNYFAIIAYQAASIEMAYEALAKGAPTSDRFSTFLLGTLTHPNVNAFAKKVTKDNYTIVVLHSGLIDFTYQAAKVIVEALNPSRSIDGRSAVNAVFDLDAVQARLDSDPSPAERLYRTLEEYFFAGYPRASAFETIPQEHYPPLSLVVGMAERWIIGHEYGHGLIPSLGQAPVGVNAKWVKEYSSDYTATILTVISGDKFDAVPPEYSLGGAIFALACLDLLQKGFYILLTGKETHQGAKQGSHPPARDRAAAVINCFWQYFDVEYHLHGLYDLVFISRKDVPQAHNFTSEHTERAYAYASVLRTVWQPVKERLLEDFHRKRPLHPIWR